MWNPTNSTRSALAFLMAAGVAFLGSATLLKAGRIPQLGGATVTGQTGTLLLAIVILLGVSGVILLAMAGKELLDARHRPHAH